MIGLHAPGARSSRDFAALGFVASCWLVAILLVNPLGEFPSVDDWAYRYSVQALIERGEISFSDWTSTNLLSQIVWGALFALPFGPSYTALRVSTLVAALLGAFALYRLLRDAGRPISIALFAALLLLFNPLTFALSFTFMSDVPYLAVQTGAMLFILAGLRSGPNRSSAIGWTLALVAQLCRQVALAIPIAFGAASLARRGITLKNLAIAVLPIVVFILVQWLFQRWLAITDKTPVMFGMQVKSVWKNLTHSPLALPRALFDILRDIFFYLGLFLLPLTLPVTAAICQGLPRRTILLAAGVLSAAVLLISAASLHRGLLMPIWPHTWHQAGIGADSSGLQPLWPFREALTVLSVLGGALLVWCLGFAAYGVRRADEAWIYIFAILGATALAGILAFVSQKFDRYLIPIIPWLVLAAALAIPSGGGVRIPRWSVGLAAAVLCGSAIYVIVNEHNHMAEKRVWARALDDLLAEGIPRQTIDAGWVFNGPDLYGRFGSKKGHKWYKSKDYLISTWSEPNFELRRSYPVARWPLWGDGGSDVQVYRRIVPPAN